MANHVVEKTTTIRQFFQMMSSIDKSVNTLLKKLGNAAKAEEVIDMYRYNFCTRALHVGPYFVL